MDIEKLIERLEAWNEQHLSVVCGNGHFACDYLCENEDCIVVRAATALSTLQAENEKLRVEAEGMRSNWYKSVEEIKKLRAELEQVKREGKIPKYTIGDTVYDRFGNAWEVTAVELHSMRTKNEWLYRCGHKGTDDYRALWHFEAFPSKEDALRREQDG